MAALALAAAGAALPAAAGAQRPDSARAPGADAARSSAPDTSVRARRARADSARSARFCRGQTVTAIDVETAPPVFPRLFRRIPVLREVNGLPHVTTRPHVVRNFLAVREGEPCTELRRAESERILRAQRFIASARVLSLPDTGGGVRLAVRTTDELSNIVGLALDGFRPSVVQLGDGNVDGRGIHAFAQWREGFAYRDGYGARAIAYQVFDRPYQLAGEYTIRPVGARKWAELSHPFLTDLQRVAWRVTAGKIDQQFNFTRDSIDASSLVASVQYWDAGGVFRIGAPGRLSLFGASLSRETQFSDSAPTQFRRAGALPDTASALFSRYDRTRSARINALWGVRNVSFMRVESFDALDAEQDVRTGFQLGTLLGRSLSILGSNDDDIFTAADLYGGAGSPRSFVTLQAQGEGRGDGDTQRWDAILAAGRTTWYLKPAPRHTIIATAEYTGGWRQRVPFQLTFNDRDGGLRGYRTSRAAGAQRVVGRVEDRWRLGVFRSLDFGVSAFADAGKLWAGDAPFGVNTPVRYGAGVGVLAAPRNSQKMYRLEIGLPASPDRHARLEFRLRISDAAATTAWTPPDDFRRSRNRTLPTSVFTWP